MTKKQGSITGLISITALSAVQYFLLERVPSELLSFSLLFITNLIGILALLSARFSRLRGIRKSTIKKGLLFAVLLTGMNFFTVLGSRETETAVVSGVLSMFFIFITPLLLLLKKKVNFLSGISTVIATIALLLMFEIDTGILFSSVNVVYLLLADMFFAGYIVAVSLLGRDEDSVQLTMVQLIFGAVLALIGWIIQCVISGEAPSLPADASFWSCALFIGIFIRAVYSVVQINAQKDIPSLTVSLIFASEIIFSLAISPLVCLITRAEYTFPTVFCCFGCLLFVLAVLLVDEQFMDKCGFSGMELPSIVDRDGKEIPRVSVTRKIIVTTLKSTMLTLIASTVICLLAIYLIRSTAIENSTTLGETASSISARALTEELEEKMLRMADDKAMLADEKLNTYANYVTYAASYAGTLFANPDNFPQLEVLPPNTANSGVRTMQRTIAGEDIPYSDLQADCMLLGNMEGLFRHIAESSESFSSVYICTREGLMISFDSEPGTSAGDREVIFDFREASWFKASMAVDKVTFSKPYQSTLGRGLTITCFAPFYDKDGEYKGCVCLDILMNAINKALVNDGIVEPSVAALVDNHGYIVAAADVDPYAQETRNIFDASYNSPLHPVSFEVVGNKRGITSTGNGLEAKYIAYSSIKSTDWTLCIVTPVDSVTGSAVEIRESIDASTEIVVSSVARGILIVVQSCLALSAIILIVVTFLVGRFSRRISEPLKKLEEDASVIAKGDFERHTTVDTDDEIGSLAHSFNSMTDSIRQYMIDLKTVTAQEERIASELNVAARIQSSMLPAADNAFPDRHEFEIYASMTPAKEVGGDFYDFFMVDDRHLAIVMADVSGKGVPAALFMVIGKTLIKDHTNPGTDLGDVFIKVNKLLCESNSEELFITAFEGVLDLFTGEFNYVNAGHEMPFIYHAGGRFEGQKVRPGFVLAGMEGMKYRSGTMKLYPGDKFFQYTDGVPEATDSENCLYGIERLESALNNAASGDTREIIESVKRDVDSFVGKAPQFDDITMLCLEFKEYMHQGDL